MCKIVYLTAKRFTRQANKFKRDLATELRSRNVEVVTDYAYDVFNRFRSHKTYGIALAFDFYRDGGTGCGLTLNKNCSYISRDLAYNLSNTYDLLTPSLHWRDFRFVESEDKEWFSFFNRISASTKAVFYLCTLNNPVDYNNYCVAEKNAVRIFADEIVRCLRSDYDTGDYRKRVKAARLSLNRLRDVIGGRRLCNG